jgi:hypothetical protein
MARRRLAVLACLLGAGCSFIVLRPPPDPVGAERIECTEHSALPTVDLITAVALGAIAVVGVVWALQPKSCGTMEFENFCNTTVGPDVAVLFGAPALVYGASSTYGFLMLGRCADVKASGPTPRPTPLPPAVRPDRPLPGPGSPCVPVEDFPGAYTCAPGLRCDTASMTCREP